MAGDAEQWRAWDQRIVEANKEVVAQFRSNAGRVPGYFAGAPMLLLHHLGARTGRTRMNPLVYLQDGDDLIVAASKGGAPSHPDWYHNLKAHPRVLVEVGTDAFTVQATEVTGVKRDELYRRLAHLRPAFAGYETKTSRVIPMFRLTRVNRPADPLDGRAREGSPMSSSPLSTTAKTRQFLTDWFERLETSGFDGGVFLGALSDDLIWTATGTSPVSGLSGESRATSTTCGALSTTTSCGGPGRT